MWRIWRLSSISLTKLLSDLSRQGSCSLVRPPKLISFHLAQVATASLSSALTRYSVKEYFLKAGLCHLCKHVGAHSVRAASALLDLCAPQDLVSFRRAMEHYGQQDNTFPSTRESKFLLAIGDSIEAGDQETLYVPRLSRHD